MIVLGIETSASRGGIALVRDGQMLGERVFEEGLVHGREIAPAIKHVTDEAGVSLKSLDLIAVDTGPGSYTGVRIGVASAKTLAWALETKLAAVLSLDALAEAAKQLGPVIIPVLDARRGQVYTAAYEVKSNEASRISGPAITGLDDFVRTLPAPAVLLGDAIERFPDRFPVRDGITHAPKEYWIPGARIIAELGRRAAERGEFADSVSLQPLYLRPSEAELKLGVRIDPGSAAPETRK